MENAARPSLKAGRRGRVRYGGFRQDQNYFTPADRLDLVAANVWQRIEELSAYLEASRRDLMHPLWAERCLRYYQAQAKKIAHRTESKHRRDRERRKAAQRRGKEISPQESANHE